MPETETETETENKPYESRTEQRKKLFLNQVGTGLGLLLILLAVIAVGWFAFHVPGHPWRQNDKALPWQGEGITVSEIKVRWRSSEGNERMALRAAYYPEAEIKLAQCTGSGSLQVIFKDAAGHQVGSSCRLAYRDGAFVQVADEDIQAGGMEAACHIETGFKDKDSYLLHQLSMDEPLWKVEVYNVPSATYEVEPLGHTTIPAQDLTGL